MMEYEHTKAPKVTGGIPSNNLDYWLIQCAHDLVNGIGFKRSFTITTKWSGLSTQKECEYMFVESFLNETLGEKLGCVNGVVTPMWTIQKMELDKLCNLWIDSSNKLHSHTQLSIGMCTAGMPKWEVVLRATPGDVDNAFITWSPTPTTVSKPTPTDNPVVAVETFDPMHPSHEYNLPLWKRAVKVSIDSPILHAFNTEAEANAYCMRHIHNTKVDTNLMLERDTDCKLTKTIGKSKMNIRSVLLATKPDYFMVILDADIAPVNLSDSDKHFAVCRSVIPMEDVTTGDRVLVARKDVLQIGVYKERISEGVALAHLDCAAPDTIVDKLEPHIDSLNELKVNDDTTLDSLNELELNHQVEAERYDMCEQLGDRNLPDLLNHTKD